MLYLSSLVRTVVSLHDMVKVKEESLEKKLTAMRDSECWKAAETVRALRPHEPEHEGAKTAAGVGGRKVQ